MDLSMSSQETHMIDIPADFLPLAAGRFNAADPCGITSRSHDFGCSIDNWLEPVTRAGEHAKAVHLARAQAPPASPTVS